MSTELVMPKLSDTMKEGSIVRWIKSEGDAVAAGEVLAEIQSDKATIEFEAYSPGVLQKILVQADQTVPVGTAICVMADEGEGPSAGKAAPAETGKKPPAKNATAKKPAAKKPPQEETKQRTPPKAAESQEAPAAAQAAHQEQAVALRRVKPVEGLARVKFGGRGFQTGLSVESARRVIAAATTKSIEKI